MILGSPEPLSPPIIFEAQMISRVLASLAALVLGSGCASPRPVHGAAGQAGAPETAVVLDDASGPLQGGHEAYFSQIKQAVSEAWHPQDVLDRRDPERTLFGYRDRDTIVRATLSDTGHLKEVVLQRASGLDFIDKTTVEALRKAQPFSSPPADLLDAAGEMRLTIRFHLQVTRGR